MPIPVETSRTRRNQDVTTMERDPIRYVLQLEMLERGGTLGDRDAIDLLRSEFALAQNAGRFDAFAADDVDFDVLSRSAPQEGVTRYEVELALEEREPGCSDEQALALLRRAFTGALNASYFLRACTDDDIRLELVSRAPAAASAWLPRAA
jgi:hypothetical protein